MRTTARIVFAITVACLGSNHWVRGQSDSAMARIRPLGSPSALDQFQPNAPRQRPPIAAANGSPVRQTAWMQSGLAFPADVPRSVLTQPVPNALLPSTVPYPESGFNAPPLQPPPGMNPGLPPPQPIIASQPGFGFVPSPSDQTPLPQPSLDTSSIARMDNCRLVTGPSSYNSEFDCGCGTVVPTTYNAPLAQSPGVAPGSLPPEIPSMATIVPVPVQPPPMTQPVATAPPEAAPPRALISFGQDKKYAVKVGQGLWGQPVAYVPGQGFRNFFRYMFP